MERDRKEIEMKRGCICTGINIEDCCSCNRYYSIHSEHYSFSRKERVTEISCSIGGHKVFNESGESIK